MQLKLEPIYYKIGTDAMTAKVTHMLSNYQTDYAIWPLIKPMSVEHFQAFWVTVEQDLRLFDIENAGFEEWEDGWQHIGMRHMQTGKRHGIARTVTPNGWVHEASFKHGVFHGLKRTCDKQSVIIQLFKEGQEMARFSFDANF